MKFRLPMRRRDVPTASELIAKSERCAEFQKFCAEFETWGVQSWLKPREKALHFGIGAFNAAAARAVELGTLKGASALFTMAGMRKRVQTEFVPRTR
jgi:hypothetical protein